MSGLLDILPAARKVELPTQTGLVLVDVRGLSILDIRDLVVRFPDFIAMLSNAKPDIGQVLAAGPVAVAAIIAAACGNGGDAKAETIAGELSAGLQAEILGATLELTMPTGIGPFMVLLKAAGLDLEKLKAEKATLSAAPSSTPSTALLIGSV